MRSSAVTHTRFNRSAVGGVALAVLFGACCWAWLASTREELSAGALSLQHWVQKLTARPYDDAESLQLARKLSETGQVAEARELLVRVRRNPTFRSQALTQLVELDYARWLAAPAQDHARSEPALLQLRATLDTVAAQPTTPEPWGRARTWVGEFGRESARTRGAAPRRRPR